MKNKLRKPRKASNRLKKEKATQSIRQSVNVIVGLPQRSRRKQTTKPIMRARGEPIMPSSVVASNPPRRSVEITTTNRITEDKLKAIQDEARSESFQQLKALEQKVFMIEQQKTDAQEQKEDLIQLKKEAPRFIRGIVKEQLLIQRRPTFVQLASNIEEIKEKKKGRGPDKSPRKKRGSIQTPQTEEPVRFMMNEEEMSQTEQPINMMKMER